MVDYVDTRGVALTLTTKMWLGGLIGALLGAPGGLGQYVHNFIDKSTSLVLIVLQRRNSI